MPPAAPIRFRCFQCQKLLGVSRSKVGAVVACPRCAVELIVPEPVDEDSTPSTEPNPAQTSTPEPAAKPSPSASRVVPAVVPWDATTETEDSAVHLPSFPELNVQVEPLSLRPESSRSGGSSRARSIPPQTVEDAVTLPNLEIPEATIRDAVDVPGVTGSRGSSLRTTGPRRDDVVLPRAGVILWSFTMLVALALAFAAGLLAGRFLWAPRSSAAPRASVVVPSEGAFIGLMSEPDCIGEGREV